METQKRKWCCVCFCFLCGRFGSGFCGCCNSQVIWVFHALLLVCAPVPREPTGTTCPCLPSFLSICRGDHPSSSIRVVGHCRRQMCFCRREFLLHDIAITRPRSFLRAGNCSSPREFASCFSENCFQERQQSIAQDEDYP